MWNPSPHSMVQLHRGVRAQHHKQSNKQQFGDNQAGRSNKIKHRGPQRNRGPSITLALPRSHLSPPTNMTSTTDTTPGDKARSRSFQELDKLVQDFFRDSTFKDIHAMIEMALRAYENYKKVLKSKDRDHETGYIYYRMTENLLKKVIPSHPDWSRYMASDVPKERGYVSVCDDLCQTLKNDDNIESIINFIKENEKSQLQPPAHPQVVSQPDPFDFKHNGTIDPKQLKGLLGRYEDKILLVDFRTRDEFKKNHIRTKNTICIEPISVRPNYRDFDIEEFSMVTSPDGERELFSKRDSFELIIIYDNSSGSPTTEQLDRFYRILTMRSFAKPLKKTPVILKGGISSWIDVYGLANFGHNHGNLSMPERLQTRSPSQTNLTIARNFSEYISNPTKTDFTSVNGRQSPAFSQQQAAPPSRRNSLRMPSFSKPKIMGSSTITKQPTPPPVLPRSSSHISIPQLGKTQQRTNTPQPALVTQSYKNVSPSGTTDLYCTTGLCNLGNSCYMNCIIQCLLGSISLTGLFYGRDYVNHVNINSRLGSKGIMARHFAQLVSSMLKNSDQVFEPRNFKSTVGSINGMFNNNDQQDCSEFLNFVLDGLHEDLNENGNKPRAPPLTEEEEQNRESMPIRLASTVEWERYLLSDFSAIVHFFQGQYASQLKCMECGTTSTTYQSFSVLSLPIPEQFSNTRYDKIPLDACLEYFTKLEVLDGDNRWHCSKCKQLRKSTKKITITRLPLNLIIHLKRFRSGANYGKVSTFVEYPFELSLTKYWPQVSSPGEAEKLLAYPHRGQAPPFDYALYGVANHSGTLGSGHYTAYVWKGVHKKWSHFDDTKVSKDVQKTAVVNPNAYVLFYTRKGYSTV